MILYSAKSTIDVEGHSATRITKFVDGEVESSYLTTPANCDCPAGVRPTCRHRQMLPHMIQCDIINTNWFYNFDRGLVVDFEGVSRQAHETAKPAGEALQDASLDRQTFTIPDGYSAVRDAEGRATGEITPITPTFIDLPGGLEKRKGLIYPTSSWRRI